MIKIEDVGDWKIDDYMPTLFSSVLLRKTETQKKILKLLIKHGLNIHIKNSVGENHNHVLPQSSNNVAEIAQFLFDSGLTAVDQVSDQNENSLFVESENGYSPLHCAIEYQNIAMVKFFIDKGADFNRSEVSAEEFPLTCAFYSENEDIVDLLLSQGADVNARDNFKGWTALHFACSRRNLDSGYDRTVVRKGR